MPRAKQTGDRYADKGRSFDRPAGVPGESPGGAAVEVERDPDAGSKCGVAALIRLCFYDEGWIRIVSHEHGKTVYFKFKFSKGKYAGGYVFYRMDDSDYDQALRGLLYKVEGVYAGMVRTTPDHAYE